MKKIYKLALVSVFGIFIANSSYAYKYIGDQNKMNSKTKSVQETEASLAEVCAPAKAATELDINNVRARINTGGDMWWDLQQVAKYFIPRDTKKTAMYSGSLWMAGVDVNGQLKCAAQRYRTSGNDFWPGPLTTDGTASIDAQTCKQYDKHYKISKSDVLKLIAWQKNPEKYPDYVMPDVIKNWPGNGDVTKGQDQFLAPFYDADNNDIYDPSTGDYPYFDVENTTCGKGEVADRVLFGDQTLWWVFNDKGNVHSETKGSPVGFEIRAQAFGFATNDEINNMTFYNFQIINRSTITLTDTYFSLWTDTDLGYGWDDYVGCDVVRGLGYCYNGKAVDGTGNEDHYGENPPAVGVDFFQGPYMDKDGKDNYFDPNNKPSISDPAWCGINGVNFGDGIVDNERFGMRRFVYHNNTSDSDPTSDPSTAPEYYNFLRGIWKDNSKMQYGGNGHSASGAYGPDCDFMFPGTSDIYDWGTGGLPPKGQKNWTEETANNQPGDRRFMHSAGPFTLAPGATNYITVGIPWARANSGGPYASVELLKVADDKCQRLFDNCFRVVNGPDAPELTIQELDKELILTLSNPSSSNNYKEMYPFVKNGKVDLSTPAEFDFNIVTPDSVITTKEVVKTDTLTEAEYNKNTTTYLYRGKTNDGKIIVDSLKYTSTNVSRSQRYDSLFRFEGYIIYQLKDGSVSLGEINDLSKARVVAQCDVKNNISTIINYEYDERLKADIPVEKVVGDNKGIKHTFKINQDVFATGERTLINHKKYYYVAVAYAYNNYKRFDPTDPTSLNGQKMPFKSGRLNSIGEPIKPVTAIPHIATSTKVNSFYGYGPKITRLEGHGNGGLVLDFTAETEANIIKRNPGDATQFVLEYQEGKGPVKIQVVDPLNVPSSKFELRFVDFSVQKLTDYLDTIADLSNNKRSQIIKAFIDTAKSTAVSSSNYNWILHDVDNDVYYLSDKDISVYNEQIIPEIGLSVSIEQPKNPGTDKENEYNGGLLESSLTFKDSTRRWLDGLTDIDGETYANWIRSGIEDAKVGSKVDLIADKYTGTGASKEYVDPNENFEKIVNGTWAPYKMVSSEENNPGHSFPAGFVQNKLENLSSVDIVFTSDKSKWTRCPVIEMCDDKTLSEGGVEKFKLRAHKSVDKEGVESTVSGDYGMGWFPGYAVCIETGERLNIIFGEDSWLKADNGNDMLFNPTSNISTNQSKIIFGGKHFVYIVGHNGNTANDAPAYDEGKWAYEQLKNGTNPVVLKLLKDIWYVGIPLPAFGKQKMWLDNGNDARIRIRVNKQYNKFSNQGGTSAPTVKNRNLPMYSFGTAGVNAEKNNKEVAKTALDLINVVPNPYYAYSTYESDQLDNRVRITNLPKTCKISIYNINGTLVRTFKKDSEITSLDWDLKNTAGIPIASGIYLIHIQADGIGERVVKWFGTMRPVDLDSF